MDSIDIYKTETLSGARLSKSQIFAFKNLFFVKILKNIEEPLLGFLVAQSHVDGSDAQKEGQKLRAPTKETNSISIVGMLMFWANIPSSALKSCC